MFFEMKKKLESENFKENVIEFEKALEKLIEEYDTAVRENRFIVGGVIETLFCALLNSVGFKSELLEEERYDIKVNGEKFSLKSNFTGKGDIRLINILGTGTAEWREPTIFFISGFGVCYADPEMGIPTKTVKDAVTINVDNIKRYLYGHNEWLINIRVPFKSKSVVTKKRSYDVAKFILKEIGSKHLSYFIT